MAIAEKLIARDRALKAEAPGCLLLRPATGQDRMLALRAELEQLKVLVRLCHPSGGFATTRAYLDVSEQVVGIAKQNEGWLRATVNDGGRGRRDRSGESRHGQNPT